MSGEFARGGSRFAGSGVARDYRALESISEARPDTVFVRTVIVEVLVEFGGDTVLDCSTHHISGESRAQPLAEARSARSVLSGVVGRLPECGSGDYSSHGTFPHDRLFPMLSIGMLFVHSGPRSRVGEEDRNQNAMADPHAS